MAYNDEADDLCSKAKASVDISKRLALRIPEAAAAVGLSEGCFRQALPEIEKLHVGRAVVIPVVALEKWLLERSHAEKSEVDDIVEELLRDLE